MLLMSILFIMSKTCAVFDRRRLRVSRLAQFADEMLSVFHHDVRLQVFSAMRLVRAEPAAHLLLLAALFHVPGQAFLVFVGLVAGGARVGSEAY